MARRRKPALTPPEMTPAMRQVLAWYGRRGGWARAKALNAEERQAIGKKGAEARWGKKKSARRPRAGSD